MFSLSRGSLKRIVDGTSVSDPVMQITSLKSIQNNMDGQTRYKLSLFDGETSHTFGILATQKNYLVDSNELRVGSVIKMEDYAANVLQKDPPKVVIIVVNFEILGEMPIGDDSPAPSAAPMQGQSVQQQQQYQSKPAQNNENVEPNKPSTKGFYNNAANKESQASHNKPMPLAASNQSQMFNSFKVYGISSLNPYQNKWAIKARVTNKSAIRTYTNAKGEGKLFNVELIDNTGEIRANGFNEQCDKFYDLLQIDHVYYISRGILKTANKQYSKLDNDYEMTFSNDTVIEPCNEDDASSLPHMHINLTKFSDLYNYSANEFIDVIGVVKSSGDVTTIVAKATNRELKKRDICLVDDSMHSVTCTLWGKQAEDFDGNDNPVVLLKGAKVGDYGGRTLSVTSTTVFQINPDIPESHALRGWFDQNGSDTEYKNISNQGAGGGSGGSQTGGASIMNSTMSATYKTLDQTKDERLGMGDKADYFSTRACILYAKKDNSMYMACPGENCNKKVVDQNDGTYRCEKCARSYPNFNWRMILNVNVADFTESNWATCFQETAETILGIEANKLGELKSSNNPQYDEIFANCVFKEFNFKLRAKMETYNDERRVKISAVSVEPIDYVQNSKSLLQKIKAYAKSHVC